MDWAQIKNDLRSILVFLPRYMRHPIRGIKELGKWHAISLLLFQFIVTAISGFLSGIVEQSVLNTFLGLIIFPISHTLVTLVTTAVFYYALVFFFNREAPIADLLAIIVFAAIPFLIFHIGSTIISPLDILGLIMAAILIIVGLVENFQLPRKQITQLVITVLAIVVAVWLINKLRIMINQRNLAVAIPFESEY
jgi:Yip1 domain